jgi:serine/threonine-protein kinase
MNPSAAESPVQPGQVLAGRYRVEKVLGVGGMGVVVSARHLELDHRVAIKFLLPDILENAEAVSRFLREARAAVKIQNEHVARVSDVGTLETGAPYMVMEYLEGSDLSEHVRTQGPLPVEEAVDFVLQACEAIAEAHSLGIVHRDLKPANLFLAQRSDGSRLVKVLDFGISKTTGGGGTGTAALTSTSTMMGSPLYMSPEQLNSARDVDARTDVWSIGIILFELLTGRVPFIAETIPQLCVAILHSPPTSPRSLRDDVPPALEAAILRCLEKDRSLRTSSVADFANDLMPFAPTHSGVSFERIIHLASSSQGGWSKARSQATTTPGRGPRTELAPAGLTASAWGHTDAGAKRPSRRLLVVGGSAAALAVVAGTIFALRSTPAPVATPSAQAPTASSAPARLPTVVEPQPPSREEPPVEPPPRASAEPVDSVTQPSPVPPAPPGPPRTAAPRRPAPPGHKPQPSRPDWEDSRK